MYSETENILSTFNANTVSFWCFDFTRFVKTSDETVAVQTRALTRTRYFYILNVIISHPTEYKQVVCHLSESDVALLFPLPPTRLFVTATQARHYFASTVQLKRDRLQLMLT